VSRNDPELHRRLQEISTDLDESDLIRMTARDVLEDLDAPDSS
jgi:hypothetical protein